MNVAVQQAVPVTSVAPALLQKKTRLGPVDDPLEREADRVAEAVVAGRPAGTITGTSSVAAQRKCAQCEEEEKTLHRKETTRSRVASTAADAATTSVASGGAPLTEAQRAYFEPRFGRDLSRVRVHTNGEAQRASRLINARAFTVGQNIGFASGEYAPTSTVSQKLLAHELTHTLQQRDVSDGIQRKLAVEKPTSKIANPGGTGVDQTNAATAQQYLDVLCPSGAPSVAVSGEVSLGASLCQTVILGVSPFFGPAIPVRLAALTSTATGCGCLCDIINSANIWTILIDDTSWPHTDFNNPKASEDPTSGGTGGRVTAPSPNSPNLWGAAAVSGKNLDIDPWLVLGHELCGHAWMGDHGGHGIDKTAQRGRGGHQATVARENLIRSEHGIEARGSFKDPNCGESYSRLKSNSGTVNFSQALEECKLWRAAYNKKNKTKYKITDRIP
jgi:hypothetical protein